LSVPSYASLDTSKNSDSSIASLSASKSEDSVEIKGVREEWLKTKLTRTPFTSSIQYPYFHHGYGIPGYPSMPPVPTFWYPSPAYASLAHPSCTVQDNSVQTVLIEMQDVVSKMSEKLSAMQDKIYEEG